MSSREFLQTASDARNAARELLQAIFVAELISPSRCIWIVSPWIRDIPIVDNTAGSFVALCPEFPRAHVPLSRVLRELITRGSHVVIATRPGEGNRQVMDGLGAVGRGPNVTFHERVELHAKGIVGDRHSLVGSMNLTFNGIEYLTEMLVFQTSAEKVAELGLVFREEYGGDS